MEFSLKFLVYFVIPGTEIWILNNRWNGMKIEGVEVVCVMCNTGKYFVYTRINREAFWYRLKKTTTNKRCFYTAYKFVFSYKGEIKDVSIGRNDESSTFFIFSCHQLATMESCNIQGTTRQCSVF